MTPQDAAPEVCELSFPVVVREGKKFFALSDGWVTNAIPALLEFEKRDFRGVPTSEKKHLTVFNLVASRVVKGKKSIIAAGFVSSTGGMGEYSVIHLGEFTEGTYPTRLYAERFEEGDLVELGFNWSGEYPVVARFLAQAIIEGMVPSMEVGKAYKPDEFMQILGADAKKSVERIPPEMVEQKTIILNRR